MSAMQNSFSLPTRLLLCFGAVLWAAAHHASAAESDAVALRSALDQKVAFHGALNVDRSGSGPGAMLYPAPGLIGLVAAVATHAIIANGVQDAEKTRMREQADLLLLPHRELLNGFKYADLMLDAAPLVATAPRLRILATAAPAAPEEMLVDSLPSFYMTQDRRALVMENTVSITQPGRAKPYQKVIRVISPARGADVTDAFWFGENAGMLRQVSSIMLARSLDIALTDMRATSANVGVFKTVRYSEGGVERMERAEIVTTTCDQLVLRTLRGNLMAVPRPVSGEADPACAVVQTT